MATKVIVDDKETYYCYAGEKYQRQVEQVVVDSIRNGFQEHSDDILQDLQFDSIMGCYYFYRGRIFYGIECDGYCHT
jgi:hypothetical protein